MVLYVIKKYIVRLRKSNDITNAKLDYILRLYKFVNSCCYQDERVANINHLVDEYKLILESINRDSIKLFRVLSSNL